MARDTEARRELLKTALIDAAERAVSRDGLSGIKARDLAKRVNCALGAIYNVFPDLDALVYEVNLRTLRLFEATLADTRKGPRSHQENDPAVDRLLHLATTYLEFAITHHARWQALFGYRTSSIREPAPAWYVREQARLFGLVEEPLREVRPDLKGEALSLAARTLFSGVHGVVSLGLDAKLMALPHDVLRQQVLFLVRSVAAGQVMEHVASVATQQRKRRPAARTKQRQ